MDGWEGGGSREAEWRQEVAYPSVCNRVGWSQQQLSSVAGVWSVVQGGDDNTISAHDEMEEVDFNFLSGS